MHREEGELPVSRVAVFLRLRQRLFDGYDDIAELLVGTAAQYIVPLIQWEAENVGRAVDAAVFEIQLVYPLVVDDGDGDLGRMIVSLTFQRRRRRSVDQSPLRRGEFGLLLIVSRDNDVLFLLHTRVSGCFSHICRRRG